MSPMQHTKSQGHWPFAFEEDFIKGFTIFGHRGHLGHVTQEWQTNFCSPSPLKLHIKSGLIGPVVSEEKTFEEDGQR